MSFNDRELREAQSFLSAGLARAFSGARGVLRVGGGSLRG